MKKRNKNIAIDVPNDKTTEVVRQKGLRKGTYSQARIAVLIFTLVLALGIGATFAYVVYTANQTPNRATFAEVALHIGEQASLTATPVYDTAAEYSLGTDSKYVFVKNSDNSTAQDETITVSVIPLVESNQYADYEGNALSDGYMAVTEEWSTLRQETIDGTTRDYIETSVMRVYLAEGWSDDWTFQQSDGTFKYNKTLAKGESTSKLISGVVIQDSVNYTDYKSIKLSVIAQAIQA